MRYEIHYLGKAGKIMSNLLSKLLSRFLSKLYFKLTAVVFLLILLVVMTVAFWPSEKKKTATLSSQFVAAGEALRDHL